MESLDPPLSFDATHMIHISRMSDLNEFEERKPKSHEVFRLRLFVNEMELSLLSTLFVATAGTQRKRIRLIKLWKCKQYFKQTELCHSLLNFPD